MAKISGTKVKLPRGSKFSNSQASALNKPINDLVTYKLDKENLKNPKAPFYVNYHFHGFHKIVMGLSDTQKQNGINGDLVFPIPLFPTQDHFSETGQLNPEVPIPLLDSITISMDLRGEGACIPNFSGVVAPNLPSKGWKLDYEHASKQDIQFSLIEKDITYFSVKENIYPTSTVFSTTVPASVAFTGKKAVNNPYFIGNVNKQLNPYKMYYLSFHFPNQNQVPFYVSNLMVSFKCYTLLDTVTADFVNPMFNIPEVNQTDNIINYNVPMTDPASGASIIASGTGGIQTNLEAADNVLLEKTTTGYDKFGNLQTFLKDAEGIGNQVAQTLNDYASYDVIVVPFWQASSGDSGAITTDVNDFERLNIGEDGATHPSMYNNVIQDIRTVPLFYPFHLHHVFAYHNQQYRDDTGTTIKEFGFGHNGNTFGKVGVALGTGLQSDLYSYEQVAYLNYDRTWSNVVDRVMLPNSLNNPWKDIHGDKPSGVLMSVPITYNGSLEDGAGFYPQGRPVYCGGGTKRLQTRVNFGTEVATKGMEQFLEIRWQFDKGEVRPAPEFVEADPISVLAGYGGHFVYLVGKKLLTTNRNNLSE